MRPSIDEVLQKLISLNSVKKSRKNWLLVSHIADELHAHCEDVMPSLLQLERVACLKFNGKTRKAVVLLKNEMAA